MKLRHANVIISATKQHRSSIIQLAKRCGGADDVQTFLNRYGYSLNGGTALAYNKDRLAGFACLDNYYTQAERHYGRSVSKVVFLAVVPELRGSTAAAELVRWTIERNRSKYIIAAIGEHNGPLAGLAELYGYQKLKDKGKHGENFLYTNPHL